MCYYYPYPRKGILTSFQNRKVSNLFWLVYYNPLTVPFPVRRCPFRNIHVCLCHSLLSIYLSVTQNDWALRGPSCANEPVCVVSHPSWYHISFHILLTLWPCDPVTTAWLAWLPRQSSPQVLVMMSGPILVRCVHSWARYSLRLQRVRVNVWWGVTYGYGELYLALFRSGFGVICFGRLDFPLSRAGFRHLEWHRVTVFFFLFFFLVLPWQYITI